MKISNLKSALITLLSGTVSSFVFLFILFTTTYSIGEVCSFALNKLLLATINESIKDVLMGVSVLSGISAFGFSIYFSCLSCGKAFAFTCIQLSKTTNREPVTDANTFTWSMIGSYLLVLIIGSVSALFSPPLSRVIEAQKVSDIAPLIRTGTNAKVTDEYIENLFATTGSRQ